MPITTGTDQIPNSIHCRYAYSWLVTITVNSVARDVTSDTVKLMLKTTPGAADSTAVLSKTADVSTYGASGIAAFAISNSDTDIAAGLYYLEINWKSGTTTKRIYGKQIVVKESVFYTTT